MACRQHSEPMLLQIHHHGAWPTGGEDDILGDELVVHDGELRQFYPLHPRHCMVTPSPVELDVICGIAI